MQVHVQNRIRKIVTIFSEVVASNTASADDTGVSQAAVDELQRRLTEVGAENADLMVIRSIPFAYSHNPYQWLWLLHRVTNHGLIKLKND